MLLLRRMCQSEISCHDVTFTLERRGTNYRKSYGLRHTLQPEMRKCHTAHSVKSASQKKTEIPKKKNLFLFFVFYK